MISLKNLSYCYEGRDVDALRDVSIEFGRGSFTAIMGANSSGKSTLARCLNGLLQPTRGEVLVDGLNTKNAGSLSEIRRRVGFVFQDPNLQMTSATVERELAFGLQNVGLPIEGIREKVERELQRLNLVDRRDVSPSVLSGGE
ncbi:MAG: ATP-binding cassette domain-containing protein, partial [Bacteroidota bacterium]